MFIACVVLSGLLALALLASGRGKLIKDPAQLETMARVHFPEDKLWLLAAAEIAGAVGLVAGLVWWPIGVAAAIGLVLYFVGAVGSHGRMRDTKFAPALIMLLLAAAALVLRGVTT